MEHLGLTLNKTTRRNQYLEENCITDLDYADDLALFSDTSNDAQTFLSRLEIYAAPLGLFVNDIKTEVMPINATAALQTVAGKTLKVVEDFKYLGAWADTTARDVEIRKALAWVAIVKLDNIWKSPMKRHMKIQFFRATVEMVLLYGAEAWTLTETLEKRLDGCYTRLLRYALNIKWPKKIRNKELYAGLQPISKVIKSRRLVFAGHCHRAKEECIHNVLFWDPKHGKRGRGRPHTTYIDRLMEDTGMRAVADIRKSMEDRELWRVLSYENR